jgi:hypothetical protein
MQVMTHRKWGSVRATVGLRLGDVGKTCYYEASAESPGITQIGWATKRCRLGKNEGVGDDKYVVLVVGFPLAPLFCIIIGVYRWLTAAARSHH